MSNALAIAAVTETLRRILIKELSGFPSVTINVKPPDRAFGGGIAASDQINLFLYQITPNAAWRNLDIPNQVRSGETSQQPLALNLHYLISTSSAADDEGQSHKWLGKAMSVLHDHAVLSREEIKAALVDNDLHEQVERVRITPLSLSIEDLSKMWTTFTTPYRVSAAYEVSVVLIESTRPTRSPLPVLGRNITVQANLLPPFPTLTQLDLPNPQNAVRFGDGSPNSGETIILRGHHLDPKPGETVEILMQHPRRRELQDPRQQEPFQLPVNAAESSATQITLCLPDNPDPASLANEPLKDSSQWLVGVYTVAVAFSGTRLLPDGSSVPETRTTNELPLAIAPRIMNAPNYNVATRTLVLTCTPRILPEQRTVLLLGDYQLVSQHNSPTNALEFILPATVPAGDYFVRLRVDGIDSLLILRRGTPPKLEFDPVQKVTVS
jgi:hypothetical protein